MGVAAAAVTLLAGAVREAVAARARPEARAQAEGAAHRDRCV